MTQFETECRDRVAQLRIALIELYDSVGADPATPQDVARKFRLNKTLTWNVARLLQASDDLAAVHHVPGESSLQKVIAATARYGADPQTVARARQAVQDFRQMIDEHAGDRPTLDLIIDGAGRGQDKSLELSRRLAFRGNSGLYGVQARTRVVANFLSPNPDDPDRLDMVTVSGYVGFRRLRSGVRWPLFKPRSWGISSDPAEQRDIEPVEPSDEAAAGFPLMPSFARGSLPKITRVMNSEGRTFVLEAGPVGNEGAFDCFWGDILRGAVNRSSTAKGECGEFGANITAPAERLIMDIIVDEELDFALAPEMLVFGRSFAHGHPTGGNDDPSLLPIQHPISLLAGSPPLVNTPLVPNYARLVSRVYERMAWDPKRFRGVRLSLEYPPLGSNVILRFKLPTADEG